MSSTFAAIRGIGRMTVGEMRAEVRQGARFVVFEYVLSFLLVTRRKTSAVFFIRPGESVFWKCLPYNLLTLVAGWWAIPWGPANHDRGGEGQSAGRAQRHGPGDRTDSRRRRSADQNQEETPLNRALCLTLAKRQWYNRAEIRSVTMTPRPHGVISSKRSERCQVTATGQPSNARKAPMTPSEAPPLLAWDVKSPSPRAKAPIPMPTTNCGW